MSEQNRYQMSCNYQHERGGREGWIEHEVLSADNWQDAIQGWIDRRWGLGGVYTVVSETSSEDGKSGIIVAQFDPRNVLVGAKVKATLIEG